jgi:hypothetical protein
MKQSKFTKSCGRLGALMVLALWAWPVFAQTNAPPDRSGRFLFIVDTSAAMRRRAPAVQKAVENLLRSSMGAQLQAGDTLGVWTFDEELAAGRFPLQRWSPETGASVANNVVAFLKAQRYQKQSRFEVVAPALKLIVKESYRLTVLLVTDGNETITGIPFDREIQGVWERYFKTQQKARMPFITVLRVNRGQIINATVNLAPWPVEFPAFPPEPELVEAQKLKSPESKPVPRSTVPSLIVIGKKPEAPAAADTNVVTAAPTENNVPIKVEATSPPVTPATPQLNPDESKPAPAPSLVPTPPEATTKPAEPATPMPSASLPPATGAGTPPLGSPAPAEATQPVRTPVVETKPALPATPPVAPSATTQPPAGPSSPANEIAPTNPPAPVALAVQSEPGFSRVGLVAIGVTILLLAGGSFFVLQRRARHAAHASLITRSMDRDRK